MASPTSPALRRLSKLTATMRKDDKFSDLTIECQGFVFKVHRLVVCLQSRPLAASINSSDKDFKSKEILLDKEEPDVIAKLVQFLYHQVLDMSLTAVGPAKQPVDDSLLAIAKVYAIAYKYFIPELQEAAVEEFHLTLLAYENEKKIQIEALVYTMQFIYEKISDIERDLKEVATSFVVIHAQHYMNWAPFEALCKMIGGIGLDVARGLVALSKETTNRPCPACGMNAAIHDRIKEGARDGPWPKSCANCDKKFC